MVTTGFVVSIKKITVLIVTYPFVLLAKIVMLCCPSVKVKDEPEGKAELFVFWSTIIFTVSREKSLTEYEINSLFVLK